MIIRGELRVYGLTPSLSTGFEAIVEVQAGDEIRVGVGFWDEIAKVNELAPDRWEKAGEAI